MEPARTLRLEGLALFVGSIAVYFFLGGSVLLLIVLALAPDVSMLAYLRGPRFGSTIYNAAHTTSLPLLLGGVGLWLGHPLSVQLAAIWLGHIGADRALGYGLKYETGFKDTHLGQIGSGPSLDSE